MRVRWRSSREDGRGPAPTLPATIPPADSKGQIGLLLVQPLLVQPPTPPLRRCFVASHFGAPLRLTHLHASRAALDSAPPALLCCIALRGSAPADAPTRVTCSLRLRPSGVALFASHFGAPLRLTHLHAVHPGGARGRSPRRAPHPSPKVQLAAPSSRARRPRSGTSSPRPLTDSVRGAERALLRTL